MKINSVNSSPYCIKFGNKSVSETPQKVNIPIKKDEISTTTKAAIGVGALGGIVLSVYAIARGLGIKGFKNAKKLAEQAAQNITQNGGKKVAKTSANPISKPSLNKTSAPFEQKVSNASTVADSPKVKPQSVMKSVEPEEKWFRGVIKVSPKEEEYLSEKFFGKMYEDGFRRGGKSMSAMSEEIETYIKKYTGKGIPLDLKSYDTKSDLEKIQFLINKFFPELKNSNIDINTKLLLLRNTYNMYLNKTGIQMSDVRIFIPERYVPAFKIGDMASVISKGKISQADKEELIKTATQIAKKSGKAYEENLKLRLESGQSFSIYERKGDRFLNLDKMSENCKFNSAEEEIAYRYIECGDANPCGGAFSINHILRNNPEYLKAIPVGDKHQTEYLRAVVDEVKALDKLIADPKSALSNDGVVYRAMGKSENAKQYIDKYLKVGDTVVEKGYTSTFSCIRDSHPNAYSSMFGNVPGEGYVMRIKLPKGTKGMNMQRCNMERYGSNDEFVLPRNSSFKIIGVDDKTKIIDVEYILPN